MFNRRIRNASLFQGRQRAERAVVYGGQVWAFVILAGALAALTSPLWLISPPAFMGTPQEFRMAGAAFWVCVGVLALFAGRSWGLRISLNLRDRIVSRERCSPWKVETVWSYKGDQISYVSYSVNPQGIARLEAWLKEGSTLLIEKGVNASELHTLGSAVAECWGVPFNT